MANIETFSLKPHELELLKKRSKDGANEFYTNLLAGYEEHGSLTKKQYDAFKGDLPLSPAERAFVKSKADAERVANDGKDFYIRIDDEYDDNGYVSSKIRAAVQRDLEDLKKRPKIKGKPVSNRVLRDGKPVCRETDCKEFATDVIGDAGYCKPHHDEHSAELAKASTASE